MMTTRIARSGAGAAILLTFGALAVGCSGPQVSEGAFNLSNMYCTTPGMTQGLVVCTATLTVTGEPVQFVEISSQTASQVRLTGSHGMFLPDADGAVLAPVGEHPVTFQFIGAHQTSQTHLKLKTRAGASVESITALNAVSSDADNRPPVG